LNVIKWKLAENPQKKEKESDNYVPPVTDNPDFFGSTDDALVWLGHATFLMRLNGFTFIIDPVLFHLPLLKRRTPLPFKPEALRNIDYLLLSHGHRDHLDEKSIKLIFWQNPGIKALVPLQMGKLLTNMVPGLLYQEAGWYQQYTQPEETGVEIIYLPAAHWHRRGLTDMNEVLWGSFLIRTPVKQIYFAGDSAYKDHFEEIKELFGAPDFCIIPIGAYKPAFMMEQSHLNPREAVQAFTDLGGRYLVPMHFGTFDLSDEPAGEPVRLLQQYAAAGKINGQVIMPAIGEALLI
jgi:L-ascorbate metabolism protein UlaG (beta-lactamase superfamily)